MLNFLDYLDFRSLISCSLFVCCNLSFVRTLLNPPRFSGFSIWELSMRSRSVRVTYPQLFFNKPWWFYFVAFLMQTLFVEKRRVALEENSKINTSSRAQETNYPHANCLTHCVDLADGPEYKNHSPGIIDAISMRRRNRLMRSGHPDAWPRRTKKMMMQRVVEFLSKLQEKPDLSSKLKRV